MNKIGFKNFRRFKDFSPLEYNNITFLVGQNNSGKSTMVKAILLMLEYLKSEDVSTFSIADKNIENANIVTFGRAKNKLAKDNEPISFDFTLENHSIKVVITGKNDKSIAEVESLEIKDNLRGIEFRINPRISNVFLSLTKGPQSIKDINEELNQLSKINKEIDIIESEKSTLKKSSIEFIQLNSELDKLKKIRNLLVHSSEPIISKLSIKTFSISTEYYSVKSIEGIINYIIDESANMNFKKFKSIPENKYYKASELKKPYSNYISFKESMAIFEDSINELKEELSRISTYYLAANPAKQSALLNIRDRNNPLAQAVHEYYESFENRKDNESYRFIKKWMSGKDGFDVGEDFEIISQAGEAYELQIESNGSIVALADKGMGSIQAVLLLLRLATIIHKTEKMDYKPIVIIEEPELNLHPALQSKLCDLFLEVHEKYKIDLIVETHSEYILRRSQVIIAKDDYLGEIGGNPFCVIYFSKEKEVGQYFMQYKSDGTFDKSFGQGFFDEASKSTLELLRIKRKNRKND